MTVRRDTMHIHLRPLALALALIPVAGSGAPGPEAPSHRIYWYFDPAVESQVERATTIHRLTRDLPEVEWIAVTPLSARVPELPTAALPDLLADPSRPRAVLRWLRDLPAAGSDHLLVERGGAATSSGPGTTALQVMAEAGLSTGPGPSTDVSISTWGKVKDLFQ